MTEPVVNDPFRDPNDDFNNLDLRPDAETLLDDLAEIADENPDLAPTAEEILAADGPVLPPEPVAPAPVAPVVEPEPQPEVIQGEDGSTVTISHDARGWTAVLDPGDGANPEPFHGRTKDEMWQKLAVAKANATRQIRNLNRRLKLAVPTPPKAAESDVPQPRILTADDIFDIKTKLAADPNLAFETWFQKRTGMNVDELQQIKANANRGAAAAEELDVDAVGKAFVASHPDYEPDDQNLRTIVSWLGKYKLNPPQDLSTVQEMDALNSVYAGKAWTVTNLEEAYDDLSADGLLIKTQAPPQPAAPAPVAPIPAPVPPVAAPPAPNPRIASVRRQPRAGLGIRPSTMTAVVEPETERPPSVEELNNMTDAQIEELYSGVRRQRLSSARR